MKFYALDMWGVENVRTYGDSYFLFIFLTRSANNLMLRINKIKAT